MPNIVIHYSSYSRGWRPLCGAPYVPEAVRGTFAVKDVTCPKCLDAMSEETLRGEVGQGGGETGLR
jgi:hypothetical protein